MLDADCVQVGTGDARWLRSFRGNEAAYLETVNAREHDKRSRAEGVAYAVRLWCRSTTGQSLCVVVADPWSTSYRRLHPSPALPALAQRVQLELNTKGKTGGAMAEVSVVYKKTTNGFQADPVTLQPVAFPWLQTRLANAHLKSQLTACLKLAQQHLHIDVSRPQTAETRVEVHSELLERLGLRPGGWLRLSDAAARRVRPANDRVFAQLHVQVLSAELSTGPEESDGQLAPVRVLSWDIECYSQTHAFPAAEVPEDRIIAIGVCCRTLYHPTEAQCETLQVLSLGSISQEPLPDEASGTEILAFESEGALLLGFARAVEKSDADILVGYNTCGFDWRYLRDRVRTLIHLGEVPEEEEAALYRLGRVLAGRCEPAEQQLGSSAMGDNPLCFPRTPGRVGMDLWFYLKRENSPDLPNLKLNTVALHYLQDSKVDLPAKQMFLEYESGPEGRRRVAVYCCKDCILVLDLLQKLAVIPRLLEMAKVTRTIPEDLLYRGQQIKVYSQLLAAAHELDDYVVEDVANGAEGPEDGTEQKYQGAHVEEPRQGYYRDPIITVDFASLYPSLMRTWNLSPETLLPSPARGMEQVPQSMVTVGEGRDPLRFVAGSHCKGLLPKILDSLLLARKQAKRAMAAEPCAFRREILNAKQLALKISANSVYGACGATRGVLQCREVAEATTATGRDIIAFTKKTIEEDFRVPGCRVVYGDSVAGDTVVLLRTPGSDEVWTSRVDELLPHARWAESTREDKEEVKLRPHELEVWHEGGFTPVLRVLRHAVQKPVLRVSVPHLGVLDCTEDHSLVLAGGDAVAPGDIADPSQLEAAHSRGAVPEGNSGLGEDTAFLYGLFFTGGRCSASVGPLPREAPWRLLCPHGTLARAQRALGREGSVQRGQKHDVLRVRDDELAAEYATLFCNEHAERRVPRPVLNAPVASLWAFLLGALGGKDRHTKRLDFVVEGKEAAAGLWLLGRRLGYVVAMQESRGCCRRFELGFHLFRVRPPIPPRLRTTPRQKNREVYDLETGSHHFHVGPGEMVAHNTDSAFVRLPESPASVRKTEEQGLFQLGEEMAELVTRNYRNFFLDRVLRDTCVVKLEMEKYLKPLILYKKKRYVGVAYEEVGKEGKMLARGLELVRRDAVPLVKKCQAAVIDALLRRESPEEAVGHVKEAVCVIQNLRPGGPFESVVLSKSLRQDYANPEGQPHVKVASLMNERDAGSAPRVGDRVEYVVVASESSRVVDKVEDVAFARANGLPPDWLFYLEALERPLLRVLEVPLQDIDPQLYAELTQFLKEQKDIALTLRRQNSRARYGTSWVVGHACKTGPPQRKLNCFFPVSWTAPAAAESPTAPVPESVKAEPAAASQAASASDVVPSTSVAPRPSGTSASAETTEAPPPLTRDTRPKGAQRKRSCVEQLRPEKSSRARQTTLGS